MPAHFCTCATCESRRTPLLRRESVMPARKKPSSVLGIKIEKPVVTLALLLLVCAGLSTGVYAFIGGATGYCATMVWRTRPSLARRIWRTPLLDSPYGVCQPHGEFNCRTCSLLDDRASLRRQ
jgi:hypothetical protein